MKKILFVATVTEHFRCFHLAFFKYFKSLGWRVEAVSSGDIELPDCDKRYEIPFNRSPFAKGNIKAYKQLKKIIDDNSYDIIHCHTPVGGVLARFAARKARKQGTKVIYTAHGFHFFKGAPKINWLTFYPIELFLSKKTDCLITINEEDFTIANKKFKAKKIFRVNGVGYDESLYFPVDEHEKKRLREQLNFNENEKLLFYVAEQNANKNQKMLIKALAQILKKREDVRLVLVGADNLAGEIKRLADELAVTDKVSFMGFIQNPSDIVKACDIAVASSLREGLPVNIMEAIACAKPVVAGDNRGHRELIEQTGGGYIVRPNDYDKMAQKILELLGDEEKTRKIGAAAAENVKKYSRESVTGEMKEIYGLFTGE